MFQLECFVRRRPNSAFLNNRRLSSIDMAEISPQTINGSAIIFRGRFCSGRGL